MKHKILSLLTLLLCLCSGAWGADITIVPTLSQNLTKLPYGLFSISLSSTASSSGVKISSNAITTGTNADVITINFKTTKSDMYIKSVTFNSLSNGTLSSADCSISDNVFTVTGDKDNVNVVLTSNGDKKGSVKITNVVINPGENTVETISFSSASSGTVTFTSDAANSAISSITSDGSPSVSSNILTWPKSKTLVFASSNLIKYIALLTNDDKMSATVIPGTLTDAAWTGSAKTVTFTNNAGGGRTLKNAYVITEAPITYTITLDKNGGTTDGTASVDGDDAQLSSITAPTYDNSHVLMGYYKEAECTNLVATVAGVLQPSTDYTDANGKWTATEDKTLYAKWEEGNPKVIFSMTSVTGPTTTITHRSDPVSVEAAFNPGSSATVYNGHSGSDAAMCASGTINLGGSGDSYFHATFLNPLVEGDVISSSTSGTFYLTTSGGKTNSQTLPYTIAEGSALIGSTDLYVQKNGANSFTTFTITRPDESDVNDPVITFEDNTATITCSTTGSTIYYTTDGTEPTTSSTAYSAPVELSNSCTVRAKAFKGASNEYSSEIVMKDCFVNHATALKVLQYGNGTVTDGNWSQDGYTIANASEQAVNFGTGYTAFKLNHTQTYTLTVPADVKVTKIVVVGKTWLQGSAGNASTVAITGFTPASGSFFDYVTGGETYVKTIEFTPSSELDYGASIVINPGTNQLGAYIEVYGTVKTYDATKGAHTNGDFTIDTTPAQAGATVTLTATPDTGYEFTSWEILKTDNSSDVTDAVSMSSTTEATATFTMPAYGVTVNATFGAARYTVTYNANVGTCATASEKQATAGAAVTLPTPTFEGCTFDGWYNDGTKIGDADDEYIPTADITLYAKWTDNTEGKLFSYIDGNYGDKFQAFDGTGWVTADGSNKDKTFTDATTGAQFVVGKGSWDKKTNAISALAKLVKGTSTMSIVIPAGYLATVNILYGAYGTGDDYKLTVGETDQAATVTKFDDGHTNAQVASDMRAITLNDQSGTLVLSVHGNKNIYIGRVAVVLTKATGTITASGWNTFSSSYPLDLSTITATNEVAAYYASAASGSSVTMSTTEATVRAEEGLMIKGTADDVFTIDVAASGTAISGNLLVGLPNGGTVAKDNNNYVFGWADAAPESPGFYLVNETEPELGAGKAYLHLPSGSSAPAVIRIVEAEDNATNLDNLDSTEKAQKFIENGRLLILRDGITYDALGRVIR